MSRKQLLVVLGSIGVMLIVVTSIFFISASLNDSPEKACGKIISQISKSNAQDSYEMLSAAERKKYTSSAWKDIVTSLAPYYSKAKAEHVETTPNPKRNPNALSFKTAYALKSSNETISVTCFIKKDAKGYLIDSYRSK